MAFDPNPFLATGSNNPNRQYSVTRWNSYVTTNASAINLAALTAAWDSVAGKPTFATVATSGSYADLSNKPVLFDGAYNSLSGRPTFASVATSGSASDLGTGTLPVARLPQHSLDLTTDSATRVAFAPAERTKLAGIATGATANATDALLRDRSTHTGTQAASTITGLATVATSGSAADLGTGTIPLARLPLALQQIAALAPAEGQVIKFVGGVWTAAEDLVGGTVTPVLDPALTAPTVSADPTSPANGSAPKFFIDSDDTLDIALGYKVVVQWRDKDGNVLGTGESGALTAAPNGSDLTISGLAALPAGTRRYRFRYERTNGSSYSNWNTPDVIVGPDDVAPILSAPTKADVGATGATLGFTSTEAGTRYSVVVPAAEATPIKTQVKAGQTASGAAATLVYTGAATAGVNTYSASGFTTGTAYKVATVVEDALGNLSEVLTDTFTTAAPSAAKLWQGAAGTNRHADTTVDGTGFIATNTAAQGGPAMVRSLATLPTKVKCEITILSLNAGSFYFGVSDLAQSLAGYLRPGTGGIAGWCFRVANGDRELFFQNSSGNLYASASAAVGDVWSMECDFTNPAAPVLYLDRKPAGGSAASVLGGATVGSSLPTTASLTVGIDNNASIKINNGQEAWVMTPRSGYVGASA